MLALDKQCIWGAMLIADRLESTIMLLGSMRRPQQVLQPTLTPSHTRKTTHPLRR